MLYIISIRKTDDTIYEICIEGSKLDKLAADLENSSSVINFKVNDGSITQTMFGWDGYNKWVIQNYINKD